MGEDTVGIVRAGGGRYASRLPHGVHPQLGANVDRRFFSREEREEREEREGRRFRWLFESSLEENSSVREFSPLRVLCGFACDKSAVEICL
jgi:hypothetical protein